MLSAGDLGLTWACGFGSPLDAGHLDEGPAGPNVHRKLAEMCHKVALALLQARALSSGPGSVSTSVDRLPPCKQTHNVCIEDMSR